MKLSVLGAAASASLIVAGSAHATIVTFTNSSAFIAATGQMSLETFNSFTSEVSFADAPVTVGDLTLSSFGRQFGGNLIDLAPHQFAVQDIDGSPNLSVTTFTDSGFDITFSHAVTAFGAGFADLQDRAVRTNLLVAGEVLSPPVQGIDGLTFFGFISSTPFTVLRFIGTGNPEGDGFALDDLHFGDPNPVVGGGGGGGDGGGGGGGDGGGGGGGGGAPSGIPEPQTWALLIAGFGLTGAVIRRRRSRADAARPDAGWRVAASS